MVGQRCGTGATGRWDPRVQVRPHDLLWGPGPGPGPGVGPLELWVLGLEACMTLGLRSI